jgi:glucokinase
MILAGDTGGTKTLLSLHERAPSGEGYALRLVHEGVFACADFPSLEAVVEQFLAEPAAAGAAIEAACFGVAGPVVNGAAKITNLPWTISAAALSAKLGDVPVSLLNDLQATALGMIELPAAAFAVAQAARSSDDERRHATIGVMAPGTGLGESMLVSVDGRYHALPTEAGHADFAPQSEEEIDFYRYLHRLHGPHVSVERVLCGDGLGDLYSFLRQASGAAEPAWLTEQLAAERNAAISAVALEAKDAVCVRALEMFVDILGAEAGNLALRCLAHGGVIIGGGIPPKILPALTTGRLVERFRAKGRFAPWLSTLPLKIALEPKAALLGAAHRAARDAAELR